MTNVITGNTANTIGVLGGQWRATVSGAGSIQPWDGSTALDWFIAADDRWHVPTAEPTLRQRRIDSAPVIETRIKVPNGDAVHRVWCVADADGITVVEIENDSSLPFAVAFSRADLLSRRRPAHMPIHGIELPEGSVVFPVGHHTTVRFGLAHDASRSGQLPDRLPSAAQVARGWSAITDRSGRLELPDETLMGTIAWLRSELALNGAPLPTADAVGFLISVGQLVRLGERAEPWVPAVADAVSQVARQPNCWETASALDGGAIVLAMAGEKRALGDLARLRSSAPVPFSPIVPTVVSALSTGPPNGALDGVSVASIGRRLAWHEQCLARSTGFGTGEIVGGGIPSDWLGANFEVHRLPIGPATTVSYAVRWHGDRPAVLWEIEGPPVRLTASTVAPGWSSGEPAGEALWPRPVRIVRF